MATGSFRPEMPEFGELLDFRCKSAFALCAVLQGSCKGRNQLQEEVRIS